MKALVALAALLLAASLGKVEGYSLCPPSLRPETRCLVGLVSRLDEIFPARTVSRGAQERSLKRATAEPAIRYKREGQVRGLDDYLARNRTTGLLILKGDTITEYYSGDDDVATLARLSVLGESDGGVATVMPFRTRERPPGERFRYASAETQVLGLVLRAATGKPLADYLSAKIWQPLGAEADGSRIVLRGLRGQAVFVDPKARLVMVHTAAREVSDAGWEVLDLWSGVVSSLAP